MLRMPTGRETAFDRYFEARMKDPVFAEEYRRARREIDSIDALIRALDDARERVGFSKADLARQIGARPEFVRRIFTSKSRNPTLKSVVRLASALGLSVRVVRSADKRQAPRAGAARLARPS